MRLADRKDRKGHHPRWDSLVGMVGSPVGEEAAIRTVTAAQATAKGETPRSLEEGIPWTRCWQVWPWQCNS